ncbi:MAG: hypothetical protein ACKOWX_01700 [Flavobacteriales bacterium]
MKKILFILSLSVFLFSCISIQEAQNVVELSQAHQRIAVIPIKANVERKIWMNQEKHAELCQIKSEETQQRIDRYLQFYSRNGSLHAEIMPVDEVNSLLHGAGYPNTMLTNNDLCSLLQVDAIIYGRIEVLEPISEAAAMMLSSSNTMVTPITNIVELNLFLYDAKSAKTIWDSGQINRGQVGSIKENMQRQVCRRAVRNMPYNLKKRRYKKAYRTLYGI